MLQRIIICVHLTAEDVLFVLCVYLIVEDVSVYKLCYITATDSLLLKSKHASDNSNIDNYSYLIFWGFNLNREILEEWITGCLPDVSYYCKL